MFLFLENQNCVFLIIVNKYVYLSTLPFKSI